MGVLTVKVRMPWSPRDNSAERDADAEIARNLWRNHWLLPPTSPRRNIWDWVLLLLVVFSSLEIPFVLVFSLPQAAEDAIRTFDYVIDAFFWLDIFLNCNTSFYIDESLVTSRREIGKHYGSTW